jgi:hypothetical protein
MLHRPKRTEAVNTNNVGARSPAAPRPNIRPVVLLIAGCFVSSGCHRHEPKLQPLRYGEVYTLYWSFDSATRLHEATFDAAFNANHNGPSDNREKCEISALVLNANLRAEQGAKAEQKEGFWCEPGRYTPRGRVPSEFKARFPLDL